MRRHVAIGHGEGKSKRKNKTSVGSNINNCDEDNDLTVIVTFVDLEYLKVSGTSEVEMDERAQLSSLLWNHREHQKLS